MYDGCNYINKFVSNKLCEWTKAYNEELLEKWISKNPKIL